MAWTFYNASGEALTSFGPVALTDLDIDGGTDIGEAIVDADLFIIDNGAGGTNVKTAASRIKTYIGITQAVEADIEAETNENTYIPPDLAKHILGVAKGYASLDSAGSGNAVDYNVDSSARDATGDFSVTWDTDFSNSNYMVSFMGDATAAYAWVFNSRTTGVTGWKTFDNANSAANLGGTIVVFGKQ